MLTSTAPAAKQARPAKSLKTRALRAGGFSIGGQVIGQALRMFSNVVLSRLLFPQAFGLMAIVQMLNMGLQMISDVGIRSAIVRSDRGQDRKFLDTAWSLQVLRGGLLALAGAAMAYPIAAFYERPELVPLVVVSSLSPLLLGLQSTRLDLLTREMKAGRLTAIELSAQASAIAFSIAAAYLLQSVWALVIGGVTLTITRTVLSYLATPAPHSRFGWDPDAAREIVNLGKWIVVSTLITFVAMRLDVIALGKLVSLETLGVYSIGLTISGVPLTLMGTIVTAVLLPALSESHRAGAATLARNFRLVLETLFPAALALVLVTATAAPAFFEYLYEDRYHDAGWMVQLSMLALWFQLLQQILSRAVLALGDSRGLAVSNGFRLVAGSAGLGLGFVAAGLPGLIVGMAAGTLAGHLAIALRLKKNHGLPSAWLTIRYSLGGLAAGLLACVGPHYMAAHTGVDRVPLLTLLAGVATAGPLAVSVLRRMQRSAAHRQDA